MSSRRRRGDWTRRDCLAAVAAWLGTPWIARADDAPRADGPRAGADRAGVELITAETQAAVQRGLKLLSQRQVQQGAFRGAFGNSGYAAGVAVCGLAGLAFLSSGSVPGRGPFGKAIERCIEYLLANTDAKGYISAQHLGGLDQMYGHGFATLFLAEACGMAPRPEANERILQKLRLSVRLIVDTQNDQGGWRYQPVKSDADLSITICQIMALRAARDAGLDVPARTREKCIDYVRKSQTADGTFCYTLGNRGHGSFALTAAGVVALNSAGIYDSPEVQKGLSAIWRNKPSGGLNDSYFFYAHYYAAQAMWHAGGTYWSQWYAAIREVLLEHQRNTGAWTDPGVGDEFGTAMACVILQLPYNFVPVFGEG